MFTRFKCSQRRSATLYFSSLLACALVLLAGCRDTSPRQPVPPTSVPTVSSPASSSPASPQPGAELTVRGIVRNGTESGCLVLSTADREYLLIHPPPALRPDMTVVVHGKIEPKLMTSCMQGLPLVVSDTSPG